MNQEFKKISKDDTTRYVLESASGGGTSAGSVASVSKSIGGVQRRDNLLVQDTSQKLTPRSPVAHAAQKVAKGSGKHTDRKQQSKQVRGEKHKTKDFAENQDHEISMAGSELHSIFQDAKQLHSMIKTKSEEEGLDAWQQSKITKAADYLNSVLQSLQHEMMGEGARTMSRAAKGMMKYGKDGMRALAKAGRDGASEKQLDTIRDKHDHYNEGWSQKYKNSINCSHPKGFSQRAHCAGKRKHNESIEMEMTCPDCGMCRTHGNNMMEVKQRLDAKCWKGKHKEGTKIKGGIRVNNCVPNEGVAEATGDERFDSMMSQITGGTGARQGVDNLNKSLTARSGSNPETALAKWGQEFIKWLEDICRNMSKQGADRVSKLEKLSEFEDGGETMAHWLIEVAKQTKTSGITLADIQEFSSEFNTYGMWPWQQFPIAWSQGEWQDYKDQWTGPDGYIASLRQGVAEGGPFSYGKPPRKGSVADLAAKRRKEQDRKTPPIEPKDQMVGNAKVTKDTKEGLKQMLRKVDPTIKSRLRSKADRLDDEGDEVHQDLKSMGMEPHDAMTRNMDPEKYYRNADRYRRLADKDVDETQLAELDRPSGKLFIVVKADNAGATHVFGDFGSFPQDVMHKVSKRGTRDKSGAKTKLKIDFLFDDFRSTIQQLRTIFRDVDFVGAEAAEFIIHSSALRSDQGEDVKHLRDYIEAGDDRRMKMYQKPEDDEDDDGETTGGNMLRIDPETGAARKVVGVKPQTQMGGKSVEQPGMTTYRFKDPIFARQLRGMNLGFNIKGDSITVDQKQKDDLVSVLGDKFGKIFTNQERFKEENIGLSEKAVSQQQQKFFGMVHAMQKGKKIPGASAELKKTAKSMSKSDAKDFAKTRHAGLPKKVSEGGITLPNPDGTYPSGAWTPEKQRELNQSMAAQQGSAPLKGSTASQDALKAAMAQANQPKGTDKDLGNGFTLTTTTFNNQNVPAIFDTQDKLHWIKNDESNGSRYGISPYLKIQNGQVEPVSNPGPASAAAIKAAGWTVPKSAPPTPGASSTPSSSSKPASQMSDEELEAELARRKGNQGGSFVPRDYQTKEPLKKGTDGNWYNSNGEQRDGLHGGPINPDTGTAMFRGLRPKSAPTNEDSYMESLSAALEQKLSVNDTPEVWRDDFEHADPVKYPQFRNKTVEKKHRMADVARYRQIQKK